MKNNRPAMFGGSWYPGSIVELEAFFRAFAPDTKDRRDIIGLVGPHAGYIYSGHVAAAAYRIVQPPKLVILLGPNHSGRGVPVAVWAKGSWQSPLGTCQIDEVFSDALLAACPSAHFNTAAHDREHSLELHLPLIQHFFGPETKIVPVILSELSLADCLELGKILAELIADDGRKTLVVASSDFSHGETLQETKRKDALAIERIINGNPDSFFRTVRDENIRLCGLYPITTMLACTTARGHFHSDLVEQTDSYQISRNEDWIVGYAGIVIAKQS